MIRLRSSTLDGFGRHKDGERDALNTHLSSMLKKQLCAPREVGVSKSPRAILWCKCRRQNGRATDSSKDARSSSDAYPNPLGGLASRSELRFLPHAWKGVAQTEFLMRSGGTLIDLGRVTRGISGRPLQHSGVNKKADAAGFGMKGRGLRPLVNHGGRCLPGLRYAGHSEARFLDAIGSKKQHARKVLKVRIRTENVTMSATPSSVDRTRFNRTPVLGARLIPAQTTTSLSRGISR
jgi:hypothetical protein